MERERKRVKRVIEFLSSGRGKQLKLLNLGLTERNVQGGRPRGRGKGKGECCV
jgi:hypothetical protein